MFVIPARAGNQSKRYTSTCSGVTKWAAALLFVAAASCRAAPAAPDRSIAHTPAGDFKLTGRVVDDAQIILPSTEQQLSTRSEALEKDTTDQLVIVTVPSLQGATIEQVGLALGRGWGVGRRDVDNGVILLVAPNDYKVRVEVGYGLERLLTDDRAGKIVRDMVPLFRAHHSEEAISLGESEIIQVLESDKRRPQYLWKRA
jgi:uncharacterized protein